MTTVNDIAQDRWSIDPREALPQKGDYITVSDYNFPWLVTFVPRSGAQMYLLSVDGKRFAVESTARVKSIWRDPEAIIEVDWTAAYDEEEDVD